MRTTGVIALAIAAIVPSVARAEPPADTAPHAVQTPSIDSRRADAQPADPARTDAPPGEVARTDARPGELARADALFRAAQQLRASGDYVDACPKFAETQRLVLGVGVTLYLADCYEHLGLPARAYTEFRRAERLARERHDSRAEVAHLRAVALEPTAAAIAPPSVTASQPTAAAPSPTAAAPSPPATAAPVPAASTAPAAPSPPVAAAPPVPAADAESHRATSGGTRSAVELGLLGGGTAALAVGAAFLAVKNHAVVAGQPSGDAGLASAVAFGVGAASLVSAIVLYLTAPSDKTSAFLVAPVPVASGAGALLQARF